MTSGCELGCWPPRTSGVRVRLSNRGRLALLPELDRNDLRDYIEGHRQDTDKVNSTRRLVWPRLAMRRPRQPMISKTPRRRREGRDFTLTQGALTQTIKASRDAKDLDKTITEFAGIQRSLASDSDVELANAQQGNQLRMTLPTFVLLQQFEEVVDLANVRLSAMTDRRCQAAEPTRGHSQAGPRVGK